MDLLATVTINLYSRPFIEWERVYEGLGRILSHPTKFNFLNPMVKQRVSTCVIESHRVLMRA